MDSFERPNYKRKKVNLDDTSLSRWTRFRYKYLTLFAFKKFFWAFFRYAFLIGISYVILFPYYSKVSTSLMSGEDFVDITVKLVPKYPTFDTYKMILKETSFWSATINTAVLSLFCGVVQMLMCCLVGYGFSKFKFKGKSILFLCVIITLVIPHKTLQTTMKFFFQQFEIWGIPLAKDGLNLLDPNNSFAHWPMVLMSFGAIGYRNGLYIFMMRQFYKGVPDELEEAAYVDGAGTMRTFWKIIVPMSVPMMVTIFIFAFSWQWTDRFYTKMLYANSDTYVFYDDVLKQSLMTDTTERWFEEYAKISTDYSMAIYNAVGILVLIPLLVVFLFGQKQLIQGIERTGVTG